ncbi:MAG: Abi family protein [Fibromonadaceae bacterium]|jgi:abortive infection bacteriophage resistance protein|nr:Abi family protein [Fibromonadaceae bacterium]
MQREVYQEPFLPYEEQMNLLKSRGLFFKDEPQALNLLERISYYRLSSYWYPFLKDKQNKIFKENTDFDKAFELYKFDKNLRKIIMAEVEKIEIAIRSKMVHVLSLSNGHFWLEEESLFLDSEMYASMMSNIKKEVNRSHESFIISFRKEYSNDIPPAFMLLETISFGTLSKIYKYLKLPKDKQEIAQFFGLHGVVFESWIHSLVYVRNICAHHARLWNRQMRIRPLPLKTNKNHQKILKNIWLANNQVCRDRIYIVLSMILYLLNIINPKHSFKQKLTDLFSKYPSIDKTAMGFPVDWQAEPLWSPSSRGSI